MSQDYVLYLRKSKGRKGISRQRTVTTGYLADLGGIVVAEHADTDRTAYKAVGGERPPREGFDEMLAQVAATPGIGVAAWHADRLIRSGEDAERLIEVCAAGKHSVETAQGGRYDLHTANGRKRFRSDAIDAQYEVDHMVERITAQQREAAEAGEWNGGRRPFGYLSDGMTLNEAEAAAVDQASRDALAGIPLGEIARQWNKAGLVTSRGGEWSSASVSRLLRRPRNAGLVTYQGEIMGAAKWPAIVDPDIWHGLQAMLDDPTRHTGSGPGRVHLLSGLIWCDCGRPMRAHGVGGNGRPIRMVYTCIPSKHCARDLRHMDAYVTEMVLARLRMPDAAKALSPAPAEEAARLRASLATLGKREAEAGNDYADGNLTGRQLSIVNQRIDSERLAASLRLAELTRRDALATITSGDPAEVWEMLSLSQRRSIIAALLKVTVLRIHRQGRPAGWQKGMPYFNPESVKLSWL